MDTKQQQEYLDRVFEALTEVQQIISPALNYADKLDDNHYIYEDLSELHVSTARLYRICQHFESKIVEEEIKQEMGERWVKE